MIKNRTIKNKHLYKGVTLAFAGILASSFLPVNLIQVKADYLLGGIGSEAIFVENAQSVANKGSTYEIRAAYFGSDEQIPVGLGDYADYDYIGRNYDDVNTIEAITSSVTVTYASSGQQVAVKANEPATIISQLSSDASTAVYGTVELKNAGEYVVTYNFDVTVNGEEKSFSTDYIVYSEITTAYFEFDENDTNIVPSVYDVSMQKDGLKDIVLPIPTLFDRNEEEVEDVKYVLNNEAVPQEGDVVKISVSGGKKAVVVEQSEGKYYIDSKYFTPDAAEFAGFGNYSISFDYYVGGQFITSITKAFTVAENYYEDYQLKLVQNSSLSSAITNVGVTLPTISGQTSEDSSPANESVAISYTVQAYRRDSNNEFTETKENSIVDGVFTPWANGSYRITYTATDFYGNTQTLEFRIDGVKDSQAPKVYMYDASIDLQNDEVSNSDSEEEVAYPDASSALKSKTSVNNVVIFAIAATDNVSALENLSMKRVIKSSSREITINDYNDKNLIFDYEWDTFLANNEYIRQKLEDAMIETSSQQAVEAWLLEHNFLFVSNNVEDKDKEGYAYLDVTVSGGSMLPGSSTGTSYTVLYSAEDEAGNESTVLSYDISIVSGDAFNDDVAPEISFATNLKNSYRANSIITFDAPTASDDNDTRMDITTEYFFTGGEKGENYTPIVIEDDEYKIDLSQINQAIYEDDVPNKVTILVTTKDDYGNKGEWRKEIAIADVQDSQAPTIIMESYGTDNSAPIKQMSDIILPTIVLHDDNVQYLNAEVYVNRVEKVEDEEGKVTKVETPITVFGKNETRSGNRYTLTAGKVTASYVGDYQVKVVITDAGNNQITTFYNYQVVGSGTVGDPTILPGLIDESGDKEAGEAIDLGTPTISYQLTGDQYDIFGVSDDSSNSATDYNINVVGDSPSTYRFNENEENTFTPYEPGVYRLQYSVNVSVFDTDVFVKNADGTAVVEKENANNQVKPLANGDFVIVSTTEKVVKYAIKDETQYLVYDLSSKLSGFENIFGQYIEKDSVKYYLTIDGELKFIAKNGQQLQFSLTSESADNLSIDGTAETLASSTTLASDAYTAYYNKPSKIYKLTVVDSTAPEILTEYKYPETAAKDEWVQIQKVEAKDNSAKGINLEKSYVIIQYKGGETSFSTQYYLNRWTEADGYNAETGNIDYQLTRDGNYTITYYVYDHHNNVNSDVTHTIKVGDTKSPEIKTDDDFVAKKQELGSTLTLDLSKVHISDEETDEAKLWETLEIEVINTASGSEPLKNIADASENRYSFKLDEAGTYKIEISVTDDAGWTTTHTVEFEVSTEADGGVEIYEIIGIILIVVAVLVVAGVVAFFVINKVKKNKKAKGKAAKKDKNDKIVK